MIADFILGLAHAMVSTAVGVLPAGTFTVPAIPSQFTTAANFVMALDKYLPMSEVRNVLAVQVTILTASYAIWAFGWVYSKLPFKGT